MVTIFLFALTGSVLSCIRRSDRSVQLFAPLWLFDLADTENCSVKVKREGVEKVRNKYDRSTIEKPCEWYAGMLFTF